MAIFNFNNGDSLAAIRPKIVNKLKAVIDVKADFDAVGDGTTDDTAAIQAALNAAYNQPTGNGSTNWRLNTPVFFPAGHYIVTAPLTIFNTFGAYVFGAGMHATTIQQTTASTTCLSLNGVGYSTFEHLRLLATTGGAACDFGWDGSGTCSGQVVLFNKMMFGGTGSTYGCKVGYGGSQCDTSAWSDCAFGNSTYGLSVANLNAISNRVTGGNFQSCGIGIHVPAGAFQSITGVGFELSTDWDIKIIGGATDSYLVSGCSTESVNFFSSGSTTSVAANLIGCAQRSQTNGLFAEGAAILNIEGCQSKAGSIGDGSRNVTIKNCSFWRIDALPTPIVAGAVWKIENSLFGIDEGSVARRETDTILTPTGKRTRGVEGTALTANSVANAGFATNNDDGGSTFMFPIEITIATPAVVGSSTRWINSGLNRHGFLVGTAVAFTTTGALPTGVTAGTAYYVIAAGLTDTSFRISTSSGGSAVNTSGSQSGVHSLYLVRMFAVGDEILKSDVAAGGSPGWICTAAGHSLSGGGGGTFKAKANVAA